MAVGLGYGYGHPNGMPGSFGVPGWGYPSYEQAETMQRSYYDPSGYGARAPGGARDRAAEKYGQTAGSADSMGSANPSVCLCIGNDGSTFL